MSLEGDIYAPLFECLESIECGQENFRHFSVEALYKVKNSASNYGNELKDYKQEDDLSVKQISTSNSEYIEKKSNQNSNSFDMFHPDRKKLQKTTDELSDLLQSTNNSFQPHNQENVTSMKFTYLKKGKGLARFNYKICKGFKKKNSGLHYSKKSESPKKIDKILKSVIHENIQKEKLGNFEKLEQLVKSESFCSTSSTVTRLIQESISSGSSPVSSKVSFINSSVNNKESITLHSSPVRKLFSNKETEMQLCSNKEAQSCREIENSCMYVSKTPFSSSERRISGILKSERSNSSTTLSASNVKFDEQEVKVLEYENDENLGDCSHDTDFLSLSDLENLALMNYNINVSKEDSVPNYLIDEKKALSLCNITEKSQRISKSNLSTSPLFCKEKLAVDDNRAFSPQLIYSKEERLEMKSHKMLLLAKVNDLITEINIFRRKNKYLEELIINKEKEQAFKDHNVKQISFATQKSCILKSELKDFSKYNHEDAQPSKITLQELNEKLISLERENKLLKKKILKFERFKTGDKNENHKNPVTKQEVRFSFHSQNNTPNASIKNKVQNSTDMNSIKKLAPKNLFNYTTVADSVSEKNPLLHGNETKDLTTTINNKEKQGLSPVSSVEENVCNPLISSELPVQYCIRDENCRETNKLNASENFIAKKGNIPIVRTDSKKVYPSPITEKKLLSYVQSLRDTTESFQASTDNLNKSKILKMSEIKEDSYIKPNIVIKEGSSVKPDIVIKEDSYIKPNITSKDLVEINDLGKGGLQKGDINNVLTYSNGDKEIIYSNKKVYYYAVNNSTRTTFINEGREEIKFADGQREIYLADGTYEVTFPDSSSKTVYADGTEIFIYQDGTKVSINNDTNKIIHFSNGQKEIYKGDSTCRVYPDGTTKILYKDGRQETRYLSGKIRFKHSNGKIINQKSSNQDV